MRGEGGAVVLRFGVGHVIWITLIYLPAYHHRRGSMLSLTPRPGHASDVFHAWIAHQNSSVAHDRQAICPEASKSYLYIWQRWLKFLSPQDQPHLFEQAPWHTASAIDLKRFLVSGLQRTLGATASPTSQRRYYTTLSRIYAYAHMQQWCCGNPAVDLAIADVPPTETPQGAILTPAQLNACLDCLPAPRGSPLEARDRAIFLLMLTCGITPQEVRQLCVMDLQRSTINGHITHIHIVPTRSEHQMRTLLVNTTTSQALLYWLSKRSTFPCLQQAIEDLRTEGSTYTRQDRHPCTTLFISKKQLLLTMGTLRHITEQFLRRACQQCGQEPPARLGPQTIRNTVLVHWLSQGLDPAVVATMAGLKNPKGLYHLRAHVSQDVRSLLSLHNHRDDEPTPHHPLLSVPLVPAAA